MKPQDYSASLQQFTALILNDDLQVQPYRTNFVGVHASALTNTFLLTVELLGEQAFSALSNVYAKHYPAEHWDLNLYGLSLPEFLRVQQHGPRAQVYNWELISEVAQLEYLIARQYYADSDLGHGGERLSVEFESIAGQSEEFFLRLNQLHPYLRTSVDVVGARRLSVWREDIQVFLGVAVAD